MKKKFLGIVLALTMCVTTIAPTTAFASTEKKSTTTTYTVEKEAHGTTAFDDITYKRPDFDVIRKQVKKLTILTKKDNQYDTIVKLKKKIDKNITEASTMATYLEIMYSKDVTNTDLLNEKNLITEELYNVVKLSCDAYIELFDSNYGTKIKKLFTEDKIKEIYKYHDTLTDEYIKLDTKTSNLCSDYQLAINATTIDVNGTSMTLSELQNDTTLSDEDYTKYYWDLLFKINNQAGDIYLKLMEVYKEKAKLCGYDSAADYMYKEFERDYTKEDASRFSDYVKKEIVPLYLSLSSSFTQEDIDKLNNTSGSVEKLKPYFKKYFASIHPNMLEAYNYLTKFNLCDFNATPVKEQLNYTVYLESLNEPYISLYPCGTYDDVSGFIHEFGHFYAYYTHGKHLVECLDIGEIHSLTNELLFIPNYKVYDDAYESIRKRIILTILDNTVQGCLQDEFQQRAFTGNYTTVKELNELYFQLECEYGLLDPSMGTQDLGWMFINHTFESPFYYISYAVSSIPALEIYLQSLTDHNAAIKTYNKVIQLGTKYDFGDLLIYTHLRSPFSDYTLSTIADRLYDVLGLPETSEEEAPAA